eukprot:m.257969 g.257969  ORF g.257969 m.257969 type:complete len:396 (+) comp21211_c0_seq1:2583-3770(+)
MGVGLGNAGVQEGAVLVVGLVDHILGHRQQNLHGFVRGVARRPLDRILALHVRRAGVRPRLDEGLRVLWPVVEGGPVQRRHVLLVRRVDALALRCSLLDGNLERLDTLAGCGPVQTGAALLVGQPHIDLVLAEQLHKAVAAVVARPMHHSSAVGVRVVDIRAGLQKDLSTDFRVGQHGEEQRGAADGIGIVNEETACGGVAQDVGQREIVRDAGRDVQGCQAKRNLVLFVEDMLEQVRVRHPAHSDLGAIIAQGALVIALAGRAVDRSCAGLPPHRSHGRRDRVHLGQRGRRGRALSMAAHRPIARALDAVHAGVLLWGLSSPASRVVKAQKHRLLSGTWPDPRSCKVSSQPTKSRILSTCGCERKSIVSAWYPSSCGTACAAFCLQRAACSAVA